MRREARKAYTALKAINAPVFLNEDHTPETGIHFGISGEHSSDDAPMVDYYSFEYGEFGVDQKICDILANHGLACEWYNPGFLNVYDI